MKWKFMFKFKNNILTLGASDVYIFNNLLGMKAWMSGRVSLCLCVTRVCFMGCISAFVYVGVCGSFTCVGKHLCVWGGGVTAFVLEPCVLLFVVLAVLGCVAGCVGRSHLIGMCSDKGTGDR